MIHGSGRSSIRWPSSVTRSSRASAATLASSDAFAGVRSVHDEELETASGLDFRARFRSLAWSRAYSTEVTDRAPARSAAVMSETDLGDVLASEVVLAKGEAERGALGFEDVPLVVGFGQPGLEFLVDRQR